MSIIALLLKKSLNKIMESRIVLMKNFVFMNSNMERLMAQLTNIWICHLRLIIDIYGLLY